MLNPVVYDGVEKSYFLRLSSVVLLDHLWLELRAHELQVLKPEIRHKPILFEPSFQIRVCISLVSRVEFHLLDLLSD